MKIFKIRNKRTGKFSTGGRYAEWSEKGKTWDSREHAQQAITWYAHDEKSTHDYYYEEYKKDCERFKKHNAKCKNAKNKWHMPPKPSMKYTPFYKNAEIVEFNIKEV